MSGASSELFAAGMRGFTESATARVGSEEVGVFGPVGQGAFRSLDQINIGPLPASPIGCGEVLLIQHGARFVSQKARIMSMAFWLYVIMACFDTGEAIAIFVWPTVIEIKNGNSANIFEALPV